MRRVSDNRDTQNDLRWSDLPLCSCSLRHWPEEIEARHTLSKVSAGLLTPSLWVSGDAPEHEEGALMFTRTIIDSGIELVVDVRSESALGSSLSRDLLSKEGVGVVDLGVVDHEDAFSEREAVTAWFNSLSALPEVPTLIHCHMGVNRSASAAVLVLVARGFTPHVATKTILEGRSTALAIYAPAVLTEIFGPAAAAECRGVIRALRSEDRRLRDRAIL